MYVVTDFDVKEKDSGHIIFNSKLFDENMHVKDIASNISGKKQNWLEDRSLRLF